MVAGRYRIQQLIGRGGMGVVLAAEHVLLGDRVAIKFLLARRAGDVATRERFLREAQATAKIRSDHVVRVLDVGVTERGAPFIVMELLGGIDLGGYLRDRGPLPVLEAIDYVLQACEAIASAHAVGIVHRDLKPNNLQLTSSPDGSPLIKVLDFGIAKSLSDEGTPNKQHLTETGAVFGSPMYMSPEQVRSSKNIDARTDIWSLGVILHELLTAKVPYTGVTGPAILAAIVADPPEPLRVARPDVPEALDRVVLRCLEKDMTQRFASVQELAQALAPFASTEGVRSVERVRRVAAARPSISVKPSARPHSIPAPGVTAIALATTNVQPGSVAPPPRRRTAIYLAGSVGLAVVTVAVILVVRNARSTTASSQAPTPSTELPAASISTAMVDPPATSAIAEKTTPAITPSSVAPALTQSASAPLPSSSTRALPPRFSVPRHPSPAKPSASANDPGATRE